VNVSLINSVNKCVQGTINRYSHFVLSCDPNTIHTVVKISEPGTCQYLFEINTKYACPLSAATTGSATGGSTTGGTGGGSKDDGISPGTIFLIIFFVGFAVYFAVGAVVKWRVYSASGVEIVPNTEFWTGLPGLIKDGFLFVKNKITGAVGYSSL